MGLRGQKEKSDRSPHLGQPALVSLLGREWVLSSLVPRGFPHLLVGLQEAASSRGSGAPAAWTPLGRRLWVKLSTSLSCTSH